VAGDGTGVDALCQQFPGVGVALQELTAAPGSVEGNATHITNPWRELQAQEIEDCKEDETLAGGIDRVFRDGQIGGVAEDLVQDIDGVASENGKNRTLSGASTK